LHALGPAGWACPAVIDRRYRNLNATPFALDPARSDFPIDV